MLNVGLPLYFAGFVIGQIVNTVLYKILINLSDQYGYKNYSEITNYLNNKFISRIMQVMFIISYHLRVISPIVFINKTLSNLMIQIGFGDINLFSNQLCLFWATLIISLAIILFVKRQLKKLAVMIYFSVFSVFVILIFLLE